jgi:methionyl aminopeptidase
MTVNSERDFLGMTRVGNVVALALDEMKRQVRPGMTTAELDGIGARVLAAHGARSAPQLVYGFPGVNCISLNDEAVHGVPGDRVLEPGDLVKIDVTAELGGYFADAAVTVALDPAPANAARVAACAEAALAKGIAAARAGLPIAVIGRAVETEVRRHGCTVLRELAGHGVGRTIHEEPSVPNYFARDARERLTEGLVITIEPIVTTGRDRVRADPDGWTLRTGDGGLSAHHEHTVIITRDRPIIVTAA